MPLWWISKLAMQRLRRKCMEGDVCWECSALIVGPCKQIFCLSTGSDAGSKKIGVGGLPGDGEAPTGTSELRGCFPPLQPLGAGKDCLWSQGARQDGGGLCEYWNEGWGKTPGAACREGAKVSSFQLLPFGRKLYLLGTALISSRNGHSG